MSLSPSETPSRPAAPTPLLPADYDAAEAAARQGLANRIVESFQPVTFGGHGYPVHVDELEELWKYVDVMHERRFEHDFLHLLGGLTDEEFRLFMQVNEAVLGLTLGYFNRPMVARASLLRAIGTWRHLRYLVGDERPPVLEVGCGSGYLTALLALDGFPVIAHDITQGFYLYQHLLWSSLAPAGVRQVAESDAPLSRLAAPVPGEVVHVPWWRFYDANVGAVSLAAGIVTCNHALCEMHPRSLYYLLILSRQLMANHGAPAAFAFESYGTDANVPPWYVNSRFYRYGFGMCHNDAGITVFADRETTPHVAGYPNVDLHNLPDAGAIRRFGEQRIGAVWEPVGFAPPMNPWSARVQSGRQGLRPTVNLDTVQAALRDLYGNDLGPTDDEHFWNLIEVA